MSALVTTFFALGRPTPTLTVSHRGFFGGWTAMQEELAGYYGADPDRFHTSEASWRDDNEYAELVTLDDRIVGALDRSITQRDVAEIWGVDQMEKRAFANRIRSLFNIDGDLLPELSREQQLMFVRDPVRYFLEANDPQSDAIMREVERRQEKPIGEAAAKRSEPTREEIVQKPKKARSAKVKARVEGQREMLLPISGGKAAGENLEPAAKAPARRGVG